MPIVEVINTGTELLLGSVLNTHLQFFAETLFPLGLRVSRQVAVPDGAPIRDAIAETFGRADLVLVTGGLGPTTDDLTRDITAELLELPLIHDAAILRAIEERFARRGLAMSDRVARQAERPESALVLANNHGTAPGLYLAPITRFASPHLFLLPGPPRELQPMFSEIVIPLLRELFPAGRSELLRTYRVSGLGESAVEELVGPELLALGLELGYCARPGEVDVRLIGRPELLDRGQTIIEEKLHRHVVSTDARSLEKVVIDLLVSRGRRIAVAESCTGGFLANRLTNVPGSSAVFAAGFVTYANESKIRDLKVDPALIEQHGAVSREVAVEMARGALALAEVDYALAVTGIAGPGGGTEKKPVGTVYIALATKDGAPQVEHHRFPTDRETFKFLASQAALDLLRRSIL